MTDEYAYVIERYLHSQLHYWCGRSVDDFRPEHIAAIRFTRRDDAVQVLSWLLKGVGNVAQHGWNTAAPNLLDGCNALVERLRDIIADCPRCVEAASALEALAAENARLREALEVYIGCHKEGWLPTAMFLSAALASLAASGQKGDGESG